MNDNNKTLYVPEMEHDACGIGFVANLKGQRSHQTVADALIMLQNMEHRGACGCEPNTGDGAGILIQLPHEFLNDECRLLNIKLPQKGRYGVGQLFLPPDAEKYKQAKKIIEEVATEQGFKILGYRNVPVNNRMIGPTAKSGEPRIEQLFVTPTTDLQNIDELERKLYVLRNYASHTVHKQIEGTEDLFYFCSLSCKTIIYKGQLTTFQLGPYYADLSDQRVVSALALVHSRFSTNTFPKWKLSQPFRYIAHNGEINTVKGNVNWMKAREMLLKSTLFSEADIEKLTPVVRIENSDSANLDAVVELLCVGGRSLPHVLMMLIPEAWQENDIMETEKKAFYEFHSALMEPWDGPASICFTDGEVVGATLDRNGLRPSRFCLTKDHKLVMSSEAGALPVDQSTVVMKGRLQPGKMFLADLKEGRIISDEELKGNICGQKPYREWLNTNQVHIDDLWQPELSFPSNNETLMQRQISFGITDEDLNTILKTMVETAKEPIGSMGADTPLAVLSDQAQHLSNYFKQLFAQVSNPPIDPIRERLVMSLFTSLGGAYNIFEERPEQCQRIFMPQPVLTNALVERIRQLRHPRHKCHTISCVFEADGQPGRLEAAIDRICAEAEKMGEQGYNIILLSDRATNKDLVAIPSLLATASVHHHLIRTRLRNKVAIVVEAGDITETQHFATLIGYGAHAINPYMAFESIEELVKNDNFPSYINLDQAFTNYIQAIGYGLLKVFSKMGISTLQSYHGAQIFEALGLNEKVIEKSFTGTVSRISGLDYDDLAREALVKHQRAYPAKPIVNQKLEPGGVYQWKRRGEFHLFNPQTIQLLQQSTKTNNFELYKQYAEAVNNQSKKAVTLRSLLKFKQRTPVPIDEVEPAEKIFKRFATGAMSFGSISHEAHTTLAIAMNRIGGKSNSGEGGEDEMRFEPKPNGDWERSAIKQVASGRFGVTSYYLTNCNEIQIKMAQGAKPGEGGQLPGHKVDNWIGRVRNSTPGVGLISPPPHHDIYSIEDLAQLIFDLKNANREARINVKLVAEAGVGTIAAGVCKGHADVVLISGHDGGTGASPLSSIKHAGLPWELGVAEAHQTLVKNDLRSRIVLQTDGQIKTGRDLAIAALLGAEEWGVATAALVVEGCIMMRKCHKNTCPVGIATQNPELRKVYTGNPEHVVNMFRFMAQELREIMAQLGFRTINEMVGQAHQALELPKPTEVPNWKIAKINLAPLINKESVPETVGIYRCVNQDHNLDELVDWRLVQIARPAIEYGTNVKNIKAEFLVKNTDRAVGTVLSNEISKVYKGKGLPHGTLHYKFRGSAGQSFAAFGANGIRFELEGEANDYFGKGLSGAQLIVYPDRLARFDPSKNIVIGNVAMYGATAGEAYIRGMAGERFCVRNSGAKAVVEGVGDHGCEYMTGGMVIILGDTGRNFAAGMSGGVAFVYDPRYRLHMYCNRELVDFDPIEADDRRLLRNMINNHYQFTDSDLARNILDAWDVSVKNFIKVIPREYKAVLAKNNKSIKQAI